MSVSKISQLPTGTVIQDSDLLPFVSLTGVSGFLVTCQITRAGFLSGVYVSVNTISGSVVALQNATGNYYQNCNPSGFLNSGYFYTGVSSSVIPNIYLRTSEVNLTQTGLYPLYTVPSGFMFCPNTKEVICSAGSLVANAAVVGFGTTTGTTYYESGQLTAVSAGARHIWSSPDNALIAGQTLTASVLSGSSATIHSGIFMFQGVLILI